MGQGSADISHHFCAVCLGQRAARREMVEQLATRHEIHGNPDFVRLLKGLKHACNCTPWTARASKHSRSARVHSTGRVQLARAAPHYFRDVAFRPAPSLDVHTLAYPRQTRRSP
eukprot:7388726-Prymnesium_polylepis.2